MNCMNCGTALTDADFCTNCGEDVVTYKKIIYTSNHLYNDGLAKAQVRDLSGAEASLRQCLQLNKRHIQARNLLGLIYFARGEVVSALAEWIISKNIQSDKNIANMYIETVQSNQSKLNLMNQSVRKYNIALEYCRQGSDDLAAIQLKKIVGTHPNMLKAQQLLALIYLKNEEYDKARKCLDKALEIDAANTITLKLLHDADRTVVRENDEPKKKKPEQITYQHGNEMIIQPPARRDLSALTTVLNIIIGMAVGMAAMYFLVLPQMEGQENNSANEQLIEISKQLEERQERIDTLEKELAEYEDKVQDAENSVVQSETKVSSYDNLVRVAKNFADPESEPLEVYEELTSIDEDSLDGDARELYDTMIIAMQDDVIDALYKEGESAYKSKEYETAIDKLQSVVDMDEDYTPRGGYGRDALFNLAQSYEAAGDTENAIKYYEKIVEKIPGSKRGRTAQAYIDANAG